MRHPSIFYYQFPWGRSTTRLPLQRDFRSLTPIEMRNGQASIRVHCSLCDETQSAPAFLRLPGTCRQHWRVQPCCASQPGELAAKRRTAGRRPACSNLSCSTGLNHHFCLPSDDWTVKSCLGAEKSESRDSERRANWGRRQPEGPQREFHLRSQMYPTSSSLCDFG